MKHRLVLLSLLLAVTGGMLTVRSQVQSSRPQTRGGEVRASKPIPPSVGGEQAPSSKARSSSAPTAVRLENYLTTNFLNEANQCQKPQSVSRFSLTDERVWIWFDATGTTANDHVRDEWYDPDGNLYRSVSWNPLPSGGFRCFWDSISLANSPAATRPGRWTIIVYYNDNYFFSINFYLNVADLRERVVARTLDEDNQCKAPTPVSTLLTTDQRVWIWFFVHHALPGDTARIEWYDPSGNLYTTQYWDSIIYTNAVCFWVSQLIANQPIAERPGEWFVRVFYNDAPFFTASFTIALPAYGGVVVIDGTDANEHGHASGGENHEGWLYMQRVLESLAARVPLDAAKVVVDLGTDFDTEARNAINSAFNLSSLPGEGWQLIHVNGSDSINQWLTNLALANTGILYVPSYNQAFGDLSVTEMAVINARATNIARYFTGNGNAARGGAVFAMSESNTGANQGAWQWLQALFPGIVVIDYGTGGVSTDIQLTIDGANTLAGLTNDDLIDVHPWHNSFYNLQGRLKVLGIAPDSEGYFQDVVLGGEARDLVVQPCILTCSAQAPKVAATGAEVTFAATHTLSDCTGDPQIEWDFGDGSHANGAITQHSYAAPGTYTWTAIVNASNASPCFRSGQITVNDDCAAPVIITQPLSTVIARGRNTTLTVTASGRSPLSYQWYRGIRGDTSDPIIGATSSSFTTPDLTFSTSYWVRISNSCGPRDVPFVDSGTALVTVIDPLALTIEAVDPACTTLAGCTGAYLKEIMPGIVMPDPSRIMDAKVAREGVVTDGVTQILLRVRSTVPVKFSVVGAPDRGVLLRPDGTLGDLNGKELIADPLTIGTDKIAFAVYRAPIDYPASQVAIDAISSLGSGLKTLTLHRPPVVLVHGVWSDGFAWSGLEGRLLGQGFDVFGRVDYGSLPGQSAGSFDPFATNENGQVIIRTLHTATQYAFIRMRQDKNVAVTQVDVVGHSMGGLVARARFKSSFPSPYHRLANYYKGDFHKLITVGSPHQGSPLADWLAREKCNHAIGLDYTPDSLFRTVFKKELGPAIFEFQTSSQALKNIGETIIPSHAIVGIAPDDSDTESSLNIARQMTLRPSNSIDELLGYNGNHDTIVPVASQRGGLPDGAVTQIRDIVHADIEPVETFFILGNPDDISETASTSVWDRVMELLRAPTRGPTFGYFGALVSNTHPVPFKVCQATDLAVARAASNAVATITPAPGTIVRVGEIVQVSFSVTGGGPVDGALFAINSRLRRVDGSGPFTLSFVVPPTKAGRLDISAFTFGSEFALASTHVQVVPNAPLVKLGASPDNISFEQAGEHLQIRVTGEFADGTKLDLTSSTAGTTYTTASGTSNVISVSPDGVIQVRGLGQESVLIANSGRMTSVSVYVAPSGEPPDAQLVSVSAASYIDTVLAPESIVAAFGVNLAQTVASASTTPLPTQLAGTTVTVRDSVGTERLAPLFFVSPGQINYQIPPGTAVGTATITVNKEQGFPAIGIVVIDAVAPSIFTAHASGQGVAAAVILRVKADGTQSFEPVAQFDAALQQFVPIPLDLGPPTDQLFLILFGTGLRFHSGSAISASSGNVPAEVLYAGQQGTFIGLDQINLRVPRSLAGRGEVEILLTVDGKTANPVTVSF